jgi:hypothetical protein
MTKSTRIFAVLPLAITLLLGAVLAGCHKETTPPKETPDQQHLRQMKKD